MVGFKVSAAMLAAINRAAAKHGAAFSSFARSAVLSVTDYQPDDEKMPAVVLEAMPAKEARDWIASKIAEGIPPSKVVEDLVRTATALAELAKLASKP